MHTWTDRSICVLAQAAMAVEGEKKLQFRNYIPKYKGLQEHCLPKPGVADLEESLDKKIEEAIAKAQQEDQVVCIAPRKPNWDLKRDLERKLEPLQAKTDKAMIQLIRMQLQKEGGGDANLPSQEKAVEDDERGNRDEASMRLAREVASRQVQDLDEVDYDDD